MAEQGSPSTEYTVLSENIGEGGYGKVSLIQHPTFGKITHKELSINTEKHIVQLKREASIQQNLHHPNIVLLLDNKFELRTCGLFLEYMQYGSVDQFIQNFDVLWEWKLQIVYDVSLAMSHLHQLEPVIIHGDLKSRNILIGEGYHAKISDFGLADTIQTISRSQNENKVSGTIEYIAPEYLENPYLKKTEKFDVYGFAVSVWEIFSQKRAYYDFSDRKLFAGTVQNGTRPNIVDIERTAPETIRKLVEDSWDPRSDQRPAFKTINRILYEQLCVFQINVQASRIRLKRQESCDQNAASVGNVDTNVSLSAEGTIQENCVHGFKTVQNNLSEYLDSENGLLACLKNSRCVIKHRNISYLNAIEADNTKTHYQLNDALLFTNISPQIELRCLAFLNALKDNDQEHVVNYIINGGTYIATDDRVLCEQELEIINDNMFSLINLINPYRLHFLYRLVRKKCITNKHKAKIEARPDIPSKIDELLNIMKRRSYRNFCDFKCCLHDTMQHKIIDILEKGNIVTVLCETQ